ncbi:MAG: glycoside hydrolase family 127 protein [Clostridia bacterium]|nr:glycoside hydrolase family 127 protein [Clostridia bacterium]
MIAYKINDRITPPALENLHLGGKIAEQMEAFFEERVFSDYAKNTVYAETEEQFRIQDDDKNCIGMWRGEFWGKWVISACRAARYRHDGEMREFLRGAALNLIATAREDGYIGTYKNPENFFANADMEAAIKTVGWACNWNWNIWCRKYTLWGLLEVYQLTEDARILDAAAKATDQLIDMLHRMGVRPGETGTFNGLPTGSIMKPVLILYRITGKQKYLDFALEIADGWERPDGHIPNLIANALSMKPVHEWYPQPEKWAKAYEMMSCLDGILELYRVTGTQRYLTAVRNMFLLLREHEQNTLFSVGFNDQFAHGAAWPNAITEPCDVIHWMRVCHELYRLTGDVTYIESIERAFYNPFLASAFADGKWGARGVRTVGRHMVATGQADMKYSHCCVNNMPRGFLNAAETFVMSGEGCLWVNLYTDYAGTLPLNGGQAGVTIGGSYLSDGRVTVKVESQRAGTICLRVPSWSRTAVITAGGERIVAAPGYCRLPLPAGESVFMLAFEMTPVLRELEGAPEHFDSKDFRVRRFVEGNSVSEDEMTWDRRATLTYGALLLTRSKLAGNTEEEMFASPTVCRSSVSVEPMAGGDVRNTFKVRFTKDGQTVETVMCDFATGSNRWSEDDPKLFNVFI